MKILYIKKTLQKTNHKNINKLKISTSFLYLS